MTTYTVRVTGVTRAQREITSRGTWLLTVTLPTNSEETEHVGVIREDDEMLVGIDMAHGEVVAGHWPDGEEWVDEIHVPNPLGVFEDAP